jgi:hypothetical protein
MAKPSTRTLSEMALNKTSARRGGGAVESYVRKDLRGLGGQARRYSVAVNMVATAEKCWWVNSWLHGNKPLGKERPRND